MTLGNDKLSFSVDLTVLNLHMCACCVIKQIKFHLPTTLREILIAYRRYLINIRLFQVDVLFMSTYDVEFDICTRLSKPVSLIMRRTCILHKLKWHSNFIMSVFTMLGTKHLTFNSSFPLQTKNIFQGS